jgi:hypothetical protein
MITRDRRIDAFEDITRLGDIRNINREIEKKEGFLK